MPGRWVSECGGTTEPSAAHTPCPAVLAGTEGFELPLYLQARIDAEKTEERDRLQRRLELPVALPLIDGVGEVAERLEGERETEVRAGIAPEFDRCRIERSRGVARSDAGARVRGAGRGGTSFEAGL